MRRWWWARGPIGVGSPGSWVTGVSDILWCDDKARVMTKYTQKMTHIAPSRGGGVTSSQSEARGVHQVTNERPASWHLVSHTVSAAIFSVSVICNICITGMGAGSWQYDAAVTRWKCLSLSPYFWEFLSFSNEVTTNILTKIKAVVILWYLKLVTFPYQGA